MKHYLMWFGVVFAICFVFWIRHQPKIDPDQAIRAIVGEASNQSNETMGCVAHAIRNRGNLRGVYGLTASHVKTEPQNVWYRAAVAWELSGKEKFDPTHGAQNWGTITEVPEDVEAKCGDLYFY